MRRSFLFLCLMFLSCGAMAQSAPRTLEELINKEDPAWPLVTGWIDAAKNKVEILPVDTARAKSVLLASQVTTRSPMGAIVYMTGGLLVDNGWIRILGSGSERMTRNLMDWNVGKTMSAYGEAPPYLLIADDAIGGFYLLNGGGIGTDLGKVYYFSPDNLKYEPLNLSYTQFLEFCFNANLEKFYKGLRWKGWKEEVAGMSGDQVISLYPPLWSNEGKNPAKSSRRPVPIQEQYLLNMSFRKQFGYDKAVSRKDQ